MDVVTLVVTWPHWDKCHRARLHRVKHFGRQADEGCCAADSRHDELAQPIAHFHLPDCGCIYSNFNPLTHRIYIGLWRLCRFGACDATAPHPPFLFHSLARPPLRSWVTQRVQQVQQDQPGQQGPTLLHSYTHSSGYSINGAGVISRHNPTV